MSLLTTERMDALYSSTLLLSCKQRSKFSFWSNRKKPGHFSALSQFLELLPSLLLLLFSWCFSFLGPMPRTKLHDPANVHVHAYECWWSKLLLQQILTYLTAFVCYIVIFWLPLWNFINALFNSLRVALPCWELVPLVFLFLYLLYFCGERNKKVRVYKKGFHRRVEVVVHVEKLQEKGKS